MDVWVEGSLYWDELNVNAVVGYSSALVYQVPNPVLVADGRLTIQLTPSVNNPFISAIEVLLAPPPTPVQAPIVQPTKLPTKTPTRAPTKVPTLAPTKLPTKAPTNAPINPPTKDPTKTPTKIPTKAPTKMPTKAPTLAAPMAPVATPVNVQPPANTVVHRINCGSPTPLTDVNGSLWSRDVNFVGGFRLLTCPANVTNNIYCSSRYFRNASSTPARYNLPVPANGNYLFRLHFAEHYFNAINLRIFDVTVEDLLVIDDLDIFATAPGRDVPRIISFGTNVIDGSISIQFLPGINNPQINGIEVISLGPPVAAPTNAPIPPVPTAAPLTVPPVSVPTTPVTSPVPSPTSNVTFQDTLINCGGKCNFFKSKQKTNSCRRTHFILTLHKKVLYTWKIVGNDIGRGIISSRGVQRIVSHLFQLPIRRMMYSFNRFAWGPFHIQYQFQKEIMKWFYIWLNCKFSSLDSAFAAIFRSFLFLEYIQQAAGANLMLASKELIFLSLIS